MPDTGIGFSTVVSVLAGVVVGVVFAFFEKRSHRRHVMKWDTHSKRGSLYFVIVHYVLARGVFLAVLAAVIPFAVFDLGADTGMTANLLFVLLILGIFAYMGTIEWWRCQDEFSGRLMNEDAGYENQVQR